MELWKNINDNFYGDSYQASTLGNIRRKHSKTTLRTCLREGYPSVCLSKENKKKTFHVHRLVALTFVKNPKNLEFVNHKDLDRTNNRLANLEWISTRDNVIHAIENRKDYVGNSLKVIKYDLHGKYLDTYNSIKEAGFKNNCCAKKISAVCKGKRKTTGGYIWKYQDKIIESRPKNSKQIPGYPNYLITEDARIYNSRYKDYMKQKKNESGYMVVGLSNNGKKDFYVHQLVALTYIDNPEKKRFINHKNGITYDNRVENLEWVTYSENMIHANKEFNFAHKKGVNKLAIEDGHIIKSYESVKLASSETGIDNSSIVKVCKNKMDSAGGYKWEYV